MITQELRDLRLSYRLGLGFGALALGLLVVAFVAFRSAGDTRNTLENLTRHNLHALRSASDVEAHSQVIAHKTAQHLYVYDGDLKTEDRLQKEIVAVGDEMDAELRQLAAVAPELGPGVVHEVAALAAEISALIGEIQSETGKVVDVVAESAEDLERLVASSS